MLNIDSASAVPIWKQIEDEMRRLIAIEVLPPGSLVPSVRELARELRVNPATVSKAYQRLSDARVLTVRRGEGTFVSETPPFLATGEREELLGPAALRYVSFAQTIGADAEQIIEAVEAACRQVGARRRKRRVHES
jgi:GntR family transcriptional regulator